MPATVIVGLQWGDEGKGKISHILSKRADYAVRFQGGANAGHTVVIDGKRLRFHMLPAGSSAGAKPCIASGVVADLERILEEREILRELGFDGDFLLSESADVILDTHRWMDGWLEEKRGRGAIGTTRRGIGPAYADKALRLGVRVGDLLDPEILKERLNLLERLRSKKEDLEKLLRLGERLRPFIGDVSREINRALDQGKKVIFEGAQGTLLDIDHGTYPYVTSSNTIAGAVCTGCGIGPTRINEVVGVAKAYSTRVGGGPLPSEIRGVLGERIREIGGEYGTTTGRPRRVGWLDLIALRYSVSLNNVSWIALTKLDVLSGIERLKVVTGYEVDGKKIDFFPPNPRILSKVKPIYSEFKGWVMIEKEAWKKIAREGVEALPREAVKYIEFIEEFLGRDVKMISVGEEAGMEVWK